MLRHGKADQRRQAVEGPPVSCEADAEVAVFRRLIGQEVVVAGFVHDRTLFDDVVAVGQLGADFEVLLHEQDGHARGLDGLQLGHDLLDDHGGQAFHGLVQHEQARGVHQRAADGQHLLLAARELSAAVGAALLQAREDAVDVGQLPGRLLALAQQQVLFHREQPEDAAVLGHQAHAALRDAVRGQALHVLAAKAHAPRAGLHHAADALERGGLARAVAPEQRDQFAVIHVQVDALQHVAFAIVGVQPLDLQDACHALPPVIMLPR